MSSLDSKAVASIVAKPTHVCLYIRHAQTSAEALHSFYRVQRDFKSVGEALTFFRKTYPQGVLVDFEALRLPM